MALLIVLAFPIAAGAEGGNGALRLKVSGLPPHEAARLSLVGPQAGGGREERQLSVDGAATVSSLPPGTYRIKAEKVKIDHHDGNVESGAVASAVPTRLDVRVRSGHTARVTVRYGTIINPDIHPTSGDISSVVGESTDPDVVVLDDDAANVTPGTILSARPNDRLPDGLLVEVVSVSHHGETARAKVKPVNVYDVVPEATFKIPLSHEQAAVLSGAAQCSGSGNSSLSAYANLPTVSFRGGWKTGWFGVKTGATAELEMKAAVGLDATANAAFSCSVNFPPITVQGMAGPIPIFGTITPTATGEATANGEFHTQGSATLLLGFSASVSDGFDFIRDIGSPEFTYSAAGTAQANAKIGLDGSVGIGNDFVNINLGVKNSLDFAAAPGNCNWTADYGALTAGGRIGPLSLNRSIDGYRRTLWQHSCGA